VSVIVSFQSTVTSTDEA